MRMLVVLAAVASCTPAPGRAPAPTGVAARAIVNGQDETGWPAVGALAADVDGYGYMGAYCTGTLIAPKWVLTAGHCVTSQPNMPIMAGFVKFFIGNDARTPGGMQEPAGKLYQAQEFRWAWWLILYPSVSLFVVMLLGVFVGEGVREAYDPRPYSRME